MYNSNIVLYFKTLNLNNIILNPIAIIFFLKVKIVVYH